MIYTVKVTVEVSADHLIDAEAFIKHALANAKKAELVFIDAEHIARRDEWADLDGDETTA